MTRLAVDPAKLSDSEAAFLTRWRQLGYPEPEANEYVFIPGRRYRADFAWPSVRILLEVEGGVFSAGRHSRGRGYMADCEKYNLAAGHGWLVFRVTTEMVTEDPGEAFAPILMQLGPRLARIAERAA